MQHFVYMVRCRDNSLYTGWSTDVSERIRTHNSGYGAKYTRSRLPVSLVYQELCANKSEALKRENFIKKMNRKQKELLIQQKQAEAAAP